MVFIWICISLVVCTLRDPDVTSHYHFCSSGWWSWMIDTATECLHSLSVRSRDLVVKWWWWVGCVPFRDDETQDVLPQSFGSFCTVHCVNCEPEYSKIINNESIILGGREAIHFLHNVPEWKQHRCCEESFKCSILLMLITFPLTVHRISRLREHLHWRWSLVIK